MRTYIDEKTGIEMCCADEGPDIEWIVTKVIPQDDFTLKVWFKDGKVKVFDMKPEIPKIKAYGKLKDIGFFKRAHCDGISVAWDDEIDIAPETLYDFGVEIKPTPA
ncbi:DUF2442 domain-containing protein [Candidatus Saccharibacteria bacterium]|nr:DUF2442 domain-containing protein [Candidatus Saccharibacteria bacterium]MBR1795814.1 DUF2442 domain-containing protein [Candidatus Saccharibacteria bacterium]